MACEIFTSAFRSWLTNVASLISSLLWKKDITKGSFVRNFHVTINCANLKKTKMWDEAMVLNTEYKFYLSGNDSCKETLINWFICLTNKEAYKAVYSSEIKHDGHLRTPRKICRKHSPVARVFYISRVFSNVRRVLLQCNTRLRLVPMLYDIEVMYEKQ